MARIKRKEDRTKEQQQEDVLTAFEASAHITKACKKAKVPRRTFYNWLKEDDFKKQFEEALEISIGVLEDEATRRAIEGTLKPVYHQGIQVGTVREYSDTLLMFLLKGKAPQKYKDRVANEHSGPNGKPIPVESKHTVVFKKMS